MSFRLSTRSFSLLALAALLASMLATPAPAQHQNHGRGYGQSRQWHGGRSYGGNGYNDNSGAVIGGVLLGLGVGALLGGALVAPPPVVYASPPPYANPYAPPPPVYYGY
jgi:hypothetical protein